MPVTGGGLPYPSDNDPIDVAGDIKALADALEARVGSLERRIIVSSSSPTNAQGNDGDVWLKY